MQLEIHVRTDVGRVRRGNEDNFLLLNLDTARFEVGGRPYASANAAVELRDAGIILAVSDGMGGALAGEVASSMAVETVRDILLGQDPEITFAPDAQEPIAHQLYNAVIYANRAIHRQGRLEAQYNGMGATFTGAAVADDFVDVVQIGDSRAYVIRGNRIEQITKDQSLVQQLVDSKQILPEEAERHALRNVILQALGAQSDIAPVGCRIRPRHGDLLLLCSDGLSNKLPDIDLLEVVQSNLEDLDMACQKMVEEANERGGEDNITVVLARFTGDGLPEPTTTGGIDIEQLAFSEDDQRTQIP